MVRNILKLLHASNQIPPPTHTHSCLLACTTENVTLPLDLFSSFPVHPFLSFPLDSASDGLLGVQGQAVFLKLYSLLPDDTTRFKLQISSILYSIN